MYLAFCEDIKFASNINRTDFEFKYPLLPSCIKEIVKPLFTALYDDVLGGSTGIRMTNLSIERLKRQDVRKGFYKANRKRLGGINSTCPACLGSISIGSDDGYADLDHYLTKSVYPLLSVSSDNLIPICKTCNQTGVKGNQNPLKNCTEKGGILNIFIPYHRPGIDFIEISTNPENDSLFPDEKIILGAKKGKESQINRIKNIEWLFKLNERWSGQINSNIYETIIYAVIDIIRDLNEPITEELVRIKLKKLYQSYLRSYKAFPDRFLAADYTRIILNDPVRFESFFRTIKEEIDLGI